MPPTVIAQCVACRHNTYENSELHDIACPLIPPPGWDNNPWPAEYAFASWEYAKAGNDPWDYGWLK